MILFIAIFTTFASYAQEDLPIDAAINFAQFDKAVKGIQLQDYTCTITAEDLAAYSSLFTLKQLNGAISAFHVSFYAVVTKQGDEFIPVKEYEIGGKKAYLGTNNFAANGETQMNVLVVLYPALRMTIMINAEKDIPVATLETIVMQLGF